MIVQFNRLLYTVCGILGLTVGFAVASSSIDNLSVGRDAPLNADQTRAVSFAAMGDPNPPDWLWIGRESRDWVNFKRGYVASDGRVIDTGNGGESHSEGQGFGMLFAVAFDDRSTFERIFAWTEQNLKRPNDALHAWRYEPNSEIHVSDVNNATDGDLFIAAALARAARRWRVQRYAEAADAIDRDILALLVVSVGGRTVLLPGAQGFEHRDTVVVNPSYCPFTIIRELAVLTPSPIWQKMEDDTGTIISQARFGAWRLPPDWLQISRADGTITLAPGWPARFSFDAVRIPLYLAWSGNLDPMLRHNLMAFWHATPAAWVDLQNGRVAPYTMSSGCIAIAALTAQNMHVPVVGLPNTNEARDYYSAALTILVQIAAHERPSPPRPYESFEHVGPMVAQAATVTQVVN